jgi:hypothetical protein
MIYTCPKPKHGKAPWTVAFPKQMHRTVKRETKPNRRKPIAMRSTKKMKSDRLYMRIAKEFLSQPENSFCRVHFALTRQKIQAVCIHHIRGRLGTLKFDTRFFCPTASKNSLWPHQNIDEARKLGLIAEAGDWHNAPDDEATKNISDWMTENGI